MANSTSTSGNLKDGLQLQWLGHASFKVNSPNGKVIYIDPWLDNPKAPPDAKPVKNVDIVVLTHGHFDHIGSAVEIASDTNAKVICNFEISLYMKSKGIPESNIIGINESGSISVDNILFTMVHAEHSSGITDGDRVIDGGTAAGIVIKFDDGYTIYHTGDTGLFSDMKLIASLYKPDLVMMCIGGYYTMSPKEAAEAVKLIKPKYLLPMHYGTFPALSGNPDELSKLIPKTVKTRVIPLKPGEIFS